MNKFRKRNELNLISKFPLFWNTRFPLALGIGLLINLLFFGVGYAVFEYPKDLLNGYSILFDEAFFILPGVLVSLIYLIVWLYKYTQHNAFKSLLPIKKGHLSKEFIMVLVLMLVNSAYLISFAKGFQLAATNSVKEIDCVALMNRANRAMFFIPVNSEDYEIGNSCDSLYREKRVSKTNLFKEEIKQHIYDSLSNVYHLREQDELNIHYNAVQRYIEIYYPIRYDSLYPSDIQETNVGVKNELYDVEKAVDISYPTKIEREKVYHFRHYCSKSFSVYSMKEGLLSGEQINKQGVALIDAQSREGIVQLIDSFSEDLSRVDLFLGLNTEQRISMILQDQVWDYTSNYLIDQHQQGYGNDENKSLTEYVPQFKYERYLSNVYNLKYNKQHVMPDLEVFLALLFISLAFTIVIILFRLIGFKSLLLSIVSILVISVLLSGIFAIFDDEGFAVFVCNFSYILIVSLGLSSIINKWRKIKAQILYPLLVICLILLGPLVLGNFMYFTETDVTSYTFYGEHIAYNIRKVNLLNDWIGSNSELLLRIYPMVIIVTILLVALPLAKKLKANPEE